uniref:AMP-dependent synthetase/ligase domain-containing protein n=1 Tax=Bionectria ochroleuca TaxID=29856 RepID=A0A8H7NMN3_BIOOC
MAPELKTHLTALVETAARTPSLPAVKNPKWSKQGVFEGWETITYAQHQENIERAARYWSNEFSNQGLKQRDTIAIWIKGLSYIDFLHIWGITRARYVPVAISLRLTSISLVSDLVQKAGAKAIIYEESVFPDLDMNVICLPAVDILSVQVDNLPLPELWVPTDNDDIILNYHSTGSTSGIPKLVPVTARWLDFGLEKLDCCLKDDPISEKQQVLAINGSFCHLSGTLCAMGSHRLGHCVVISQAIPPTQEEITTLVNEHGLTRLFMFASFVTGMVRKSRTNPTTLSLLQGLSLALSGGAPLDPREEAWAREQRVNLLDIYASTEVGIMLSTAQGDDANPAYLQPFPGTKYRFVAEDDPAQDDSLGERLLELVIPPESRDCPHVSLRNPTTGDFHTGDLFVEPAPGHYVYKGRNDDWIKMMVPLRCDTKSIEDNVMDLCGTDLVSAAVCVGTGRPSPVLLVEPLTDATSDASVNEEILRRITPFHQRREHSPGQPRVAFNDRPLSEPSKWHWISSLPSFRLE